MGSIVTPFPRWKEPQWQLSILSHLDILGLSRNRSQDLLLGIPISDQLLTISSTVNPPLSQRTRAPTALLDMLSLISPPRARLSVPLLSSPARRSSIARSLFSLPASLSQLARRVLQAEVRVFPEARVKADVVDHQAVDVAEDVVVEDEVAVPLVV